MCSVRTRRRILSPIIRGGVRDDVVLGLEHIITDAGISTRSDTSLRDGWGVRQLVTGISVSIDYTQNIQLYTRLCVNELKVKKLGFFN